MNKKTIGILICMLLIAAAVLPVAGIMTVRNTKRVERSLSSDKVIKQNIEDPLIINEKEDPTPQPGIIKTGYLSIPSADFVPFDHTIQYYNYGNYLTGEWASFFAPVYLPHEAKVTKLTFYWEDHSTTYDTELNFNRYPFGGANELMASVKSSGNTGTGSSQDITIDYADIDNSGYCYFLHLFIPDIIYTIFYDSAVIEYEYEVRVNLNDISEGQQTQESQDLISS